MDFSQCTWKKYVIMHHAAESLSVKDKRRIFNLMRSDDITADHLIPDIGLTMGEFAFWQLIGEGKRKAHS